MKYCSTRDSKLRYSPKEAVLKGIAPDGGLFVPVEYPEHFNWKECVLKPDFEISAYILASMFPDYENMDALVKRAYTGKFDNNELSPLVGVGDMYSLELWHGPTSAFKDVALSVLPHLITEAAKTSGEERKIHILTATSGDTGKAALEGFKDVEGTEITVFYPESGVSAVQKAQMVSQEGGNVTVCAVRGNFDDCQRGVKEAFSELSDNALLKENGITLSSANSINIGRLVPQIAYYFIAYRQLYSRGAIEMGEYVDFTVPTGNFGDILAGYYAKQLGLPVGKLVCASNANNVLTDFFNTGVYNRNRSFFKTASPSMDILVSSNLERLLYILSGEDDAGVRKLMNELVSSGQYETNLDLSQFAAYFCDDEKTAETISYIYNNTGYVCDPHTAVGFYAARKYAEENSTANPMVVLSTASPFKFADFVLSALGEPRCSNAIDALSEKTGLPVPVNLKGILNKKVLHTGVIDNNAISAYVLNKSLPAGEVVIKAPATSANLGPGFDTFGIAWQLYNEIAFSLNTDKLCFEGCEEQYANENNLAYSAFAETLKKAGRIVPPVKITFRKTDIPVCRGLGSSSALIVAGVRAADSLFGLNLSLKDMLETATSCEGHPDNVAPAIYGGLTVSAMSQGKPLTVGFSVSDELEFAAVIPDFELSTEKARAALPKQVPHSDAVFNVSHGAILLKALETADCGLLKTALEDKLHEPFRSPLIPGFEKAKQLALDNGAAGVCISGAGSTILVIARRGTGIAGKLAELIAPEFPGWIVKELKLLKK